MIMRLKALFLVAIMTLAATPVAADVNATLTWDPAPDADDYEVEYVGTSVDILSGLSKSFGGLSIQQDHTFRVRAVNHAGTSDWVTRTVSSESQSASSSTSYSCPWDGWTMHDSTTCKTERSTSTSYTCPSGYSKVNSSTCRKTRSASVSYSCPSGYSYDGGGMCVTYLGGNPIPVYEEADASYSCPWSGWSKHGTTTCKTETSTSVSYSCPWSGYTKINNSTCRKTRSAESNVEYDCGSGWERSGSTCYRLTTN